MLEDNLDLSAVLSLARISISVANRDEDSLEGELRSTLHSGISLEVIREAILQCYLFAGYASVINAFILLNEIVQDDHHFYREQSVESVDYWKARGEDLCKKIYGDQYPKLIENMNKLHPDLGDWMIWEGYGKVLGRPFLTPRIRELLIVGMTAVTQVQRQFHSHVRGALNVGASVSEIKAVFACAKPYMKESTAETFQNLLKNLSAK